MFRVIRGVQSVVGLSLVLFMVCAAQAQQPGRPIVVGSPSGYRHHHHHYPHHHHIYPVVPIQPSISLLPVAPTTNLGFFGYADPNYGLVVQSVVFGSRAQRLGLETNDIIVEINGWAIRSDSDYFTAMQSSGGGGQMVVLDSRTQQYMSVSFGADGWPVGPYYNGGTTVYNYIPPRSVPYSSPARPLTASVARAR